MISAAAGVGTAIGVTALFIVLIALAVVYNQGGFGA